MTLQEKLNAKRNELVELKSAIEAGDAEAITKAGEIADAIEELERSIAGANRANDILKAIGTPAGEDVAEDLSKGGMKELQKKAKNVDKSRKGWSIGANFKAATDVITSVQIADIDKEIVPQPRVARAADLLTQARVSGNAVTYFTEDGWEGDSPDIVAEDAKKPQGSDGFTPHTEALIKIAGYVKETDEVLDDNDFLADSVDEVMRYRLVKKENAYVINKIQNVTGAQSITYDEDANETMADGILKAKTEIDANTAYTANVVFMNPTDYYNLIIAKDSNGQYYGGGYFTGAYGNGQYGAAYTPWGLIAFVDSTVTQGSPVVAATQGAMKFYRKNDIAVRVYDQNEDDAIYNRVTIVAEERALAVVKAPAAVAIVSAAE